jgi:hypothetical protein
MRTAAALGLTTILLTSACSSTSSQQPTPTTPPPSTPSATATPSTTSAPTATTPTQPPAPTKLPSTLDPANYLEAVTNPWFPLKPGQQRIYRGVKDGKPAYEVFAVTSETKTILGVRCVVVRDTLNLNGKLAEKTDDWYAQDKAGNVWYLGEQTATYKSNGAVESREGTWQAGVDGAKAGIYITSTPQLGVDYQQEYYKGQAEDHFVATDLSVPVKIPYGSFPKALRTKEFTPLEPGVIDHKYYVSGVGVVKEASEDGAERLDLVSFKR